LQETIELIKAFPWAREQYAELGLTGPSVTILDEHGTYLKAGIYYGGKYTLYHVDAKNRYHELKNITIDLVYAKVIEFFNENLDFQNFTKSSFSFGLRRYFVTKSFVYHTKLWKLSYLLFLWNLYALMFLCLIIYFLWHDQTGASMVILMAPIVILGSLTAIYAYRFSKLKRQQLTISRGNDTFYFGNNGDNIKIYNKADISKIIHYIAKGSRKSNETELFEVVFKDDTFIIFSNLLISFSTLSEKFSNKWKFPIITAEKWMSAFLRLIPRKGDLD
jgi:hypothetical protein